MLVIQTEFIATLAEQLQKLSYSLPQDFYARYLEAYRRERSATAKNAMRQVLENAGIARTSQRPLCQDTGIVIAFLEIGREVKWQGDMTPEEMVNAAVKTAYNDYPANLLRKSVVAHPATTRENTNDNTPAITHITIVRGDKLNVKLIAKGGGSEFKTAFAVLNPSDSIADWVVETMPKLGSGWCPPGIVALGIGGTAEKAMILSKEALFNPLDINEIIQRGAKNEIDCLRTELYQKINNLKIGAQGFGGDCTVLDVLIKESPTHAATLPVALTVSCSATRHTHFEYPLCKEINTEKTNSELLNEDAPAKNTAFFLNTNISSRAEFGRLRAGDCVKLSGTIYTARDAAHQRLQDLFSSGKPLPSGLDFNNAFIYYVGPVEAVNGEIIGPAGPTTSRRMDKFSRFMLEDLHIAGMIGKGERSAQTTDLIRRSGAVYFAAVGGAACLISKSIKSSRTVAFADLGMEAIYEFEIENMPLIVAIDSKGNSIYR